MNNTFLCGAYLCNASMCHMPSVTHFLTVQHLLLRIINYFSTQPLFHNVTLLFLSQSSLQQYKGFYIRMCQMKKIKCSNCTMYMYIVHLMIPGLFKGWIMHIRINHYPVLWIVSTKQIYIVLLCYPLDSESFIQYR